MLLKCLLFTHMLLLYTLKTYLLIQQPLISEQHFYRCHLLLNICSVLFWHCLYFYIHIAFFFGIAFNLIFNLNWGLTVWISWWQQEFRVSWGTSGQCCYTISSLWKKVSKNRAQYAVNINTFFYIAFSQVFYLSVNLNYNVMAENYLHLFHFSTDFCSYSAAFIVFYAKIHI